MDAEAAAVPVGLNPFNAFGILFGLCPWGNWWIRCVPKSIFRIGKNILCMNLSDSMYVVLSSNSWCPMKIVTTPIPYSMYLGSIIYIHTHFKDSLFKVGWPSPTIGSLDLRLNQSPKIHVDSRLQDLLQTGDRIESLPLGGKQVKT